MDDPRDLSRIDGQLGQVIRRLATILAEQDYWDVLDGDTMFFLRAALLNLEEAARRRERVRDPFR